MTRKDIFEKVWSETENLPYQQVVDLANQIVEYANIAIAEAQKNRTAELARREQKALSDSDKGKRFVLKASDGCYVAADHEPHFSPNREDAIWYDNAEDALNDLPFYEIQTRKELSVIAVSNEKTN